MVSGLRCLPKEGWAVNVGLVSNEGQQVLQGRTGTIPPAEAADSQTDANKRRLLPHCPIACVCLPVCAIQHCLLNQVLSTLSVQHIVCSEFLHLLKLIFLCFLPLIFAVLSQQISLFLNILFVCRLSSLTQLLGTQTNIIIIVITDDEKVFKSGTSLPVGTGSSGKKDKFYLFCILVFILKCKQQNGNLNKAKTLYNANRCQTTRLFNIC